MDSIGPALEKPWILFLRYGGVVIREEKHRCIDIVYNHPEVD
jgi:hypothetical protein